MFFVVVLFMNRRQCQKLAMLWGNMSDTDEKAGANKAPALDRFTAICDFLIARGAATFTDIQKGVGLAKSTTNALVSTMLAHQLLRANPDGTFSLGLKLYEYGTKAMEAFDIRRESMPDICELRDATNLTCHLGVLTGDEAFYLIKLPSSHAIQVNTWEGKRVSLHCSGLGKALLAWQSRETLDKIFCEESLVTYTPATIATRTALYRQFEEIREQGWAFDNGEEDPDIRCVAGPIFGPAGEVVAAISVVGAAFQLPENAVCETAKLVRAYCARISRRLGYKGNPGQ